MRRVVLHWNTEHRNSKNVFVLFLQVVSSFIVLLYMKITTNILFLHFWTSVKIDMKFSRPRQHTGGVCAGTVRSKSSRPHLDRGETEYELNSASLKQSPASEERGVRGQSREREKGQSHRQFHTVMCFKAVPSAGVRTTSSFHITRNPEASR